MSKLNVLENLLGHKENQYWCGLPETNDNIRIHPCEELDTKIRGGTRCEECPFDSEDIWERVQKQLN
ncbi:hypothetical protein [Vibrio phage vB_VhaP_PG11]|nr:hypothetical protein [Vibrio phage vB_VhaP_PG11]